MSTQQRIFRLLRESRAQEAKVARRSGRPTNLREEEELTIEYNQDDVTITIDADKDVDEVESVEICKCLDCFYVGTDFIVCPNCGSTNIEVPVVIEQEDDVVVITEVGLEPEISLEDEVTIDSTQEGRKRAQEAKVARRSAKPTKLTRGNKAINLREEEDTEDDEKDDKDVVYVTCPECGHEDKQSLFALNLEDGTLQCPNCETIFDIVEVVEEKLVRKGPKRRRYKRTNEEFDANDITSETEIEEVNPDDIDGLQLCRCSNCGYEGVKDALFKNEEGDLECPECHTIIIAASEDEESDIDVEDLDEEEVIEKYINNALIPKSVRESYRKGNKVVVKRHIKENYGTFGKTLTESKSKLVVSNFMNNVRLPNRVLKAYNKGNISLVESYLRTAYKVPFKG